MDARQMEGLRIAQTSRIRKDGKVWIVPSQSGNKTYKVSFNGHEPTCTCPDCELHSGKCKHIWAVEYFVKQEIDAEGNKSTTRAVKVTYTQDWSSYNKAQCNEQGLFMKLLSDLCKNVPQPAYVFGRPTMPLSDMVFASALKVYSTFSLRRFMSLMNIAIEKNHIDKTCSFVTVGSYMRSPELTPVLEKLIQLTSLPLASVEKDFAVDSSGFSTCRFDRWFSFKQGRAVSWRAWLKAHITCGTKTNIITSVRITESTNADSPQFKGMVEETAQNFQINEVVADKGYSSRENLETVEKLGGEAFIPFKKGTTGKARGSLLWSKMYHYFMFNREEFLEHYHKRSNVETTFHMIKTKFGDSLRSKDKTAQLNAVLLKILCHNICVVIQEMFELGIEPQFCKISEGAVKKVEGN